MGFFAIFSRKARQRERVAIEIDLGAGVLERCLVCRGIYDRGHDDRLPDAEQEALRRLHSRDPSVQVFAGDTAKLLRQLRTVRRQFRYHCTCQDTG